MAHPPSTAGLKFVREIMEVTGLGMGSKLVRMGVGCLVAALLWFLCCGVGLGMLSVRKTRNSDRIALQYVILFLLECIVIVSEPRQDLVTVEESHRR